MHSLELKQFRLAIVCGPSHRVHLNKEYVVRNCGKRHRDEKGLLVYGTMDESQSIQPVDRKPTRGCHWTKVGGV
jgi:hypothetical protein